MSLVGHNTEAMNKTANDLSNHAENYVMNITRLYSLVEEFAGSQQFSGGLANEFKNNVLDKKQKFLSYSDTFNAVADLLKKTASGIDSDTARLTSFYKNNNPLG